LHNDKDHQAVFVGDPNTRPTNPRRRTAAILQKTVKSPYLSNMDMDVDQIWQDGADWPLQGFKNQDGGGRHFEKPQKSRYLKNG